MNLLPSDSSSIRSLLLSSLLLLAVAFTAWGSPEADQQSALSDQEVVSDAAMERTISSEIQKADLLKRQALEASSEGNAEQAVAYIKDYLYLTADLSVINDHLFQNIADTQVYVDLKDEFLFENNAIAWLYVYAGLIGLFVSFFLLFRKHRDRASMILIGLFVLFNSFFLLHLSLYKLHAEYHLPHMLYFSTTFSFLYGPLLYLYFRRITERYTFRWIDLLHLLPSLILLVYITPFYMMSGVEKFGVMMGRDSRLLPGGHTIVLIKTVSLVIYGLLIVQLYRKHTLNSFKKQDRQQLLWQRNIMGMFIAYTISYMIYGSILTGVLPIRELFETQTLVMTAMVFYIAYLSYAQPEIFAGSLQIINPVDLFKYRKSRLTPSFSSELRNELLRLLDQEKIFKQNDLSLDMLAERLGTNRHNASQVINEHFDMNFFELINSYRIKEAIEIFRNDRKKNLSIIEVAYEVGFNNKVTFNKSFKKHLSQTPSQFITSLEG